MILCGGCQNQSITNAMYSFSKLYISNQGGQKYVSGRTNAVIIFGRPPACTCLVNNDIRTPDLATKSLTSHHLAPLTAARNMQYKVSVIVYATEILYC